MISDRKLTLKDKLGYGSAAVGDAIAYSFTATFLLFFLTTVAGIQPAMAGTLTVIAAIWNAAINPVMGYLSDHAVTKRGRRRPFMLFFCIPILITLVLLFTAINTVYWLKIVYYGIMVVLFWTCFTGFFVPFYALGTEYTQDYDGRTSLRTYASFFNLLGTFFSMVLPTALVDYLCSLGLTEQHAWTLTAAGLGTLCVISILITVIFSKEVDTPATPEELAAPRQKLNVGEMVREYAQVVSLPPMRWLLCASLCFLIAYSMSLSDFVYFFTYNMECDGTHLSMALGARCIFGIIITPLAAMLCKATDKRTAMIIILLGSGACLIAFRFIPLSNIVVLGIFILITVISTSLYWQIVPAIFYDVCEYDEYKTGQRREGSILAMQGLTEAVASGLGAQLLGIILQYAGFDGTADTQSPLALEWIYNCLTWVPVIFLALTAVALFIFPITKKYYNEIIEELNRRKGK